MRDLNSRFTDYNPKTRPPKLIIAVEDAAIATVLEAGPLPESLEGMSAYVRNWCQLMRAHDRSLAALTDREIMQWLKEF
jgi:hypothetical protein